MKLHDYQSRGIDFWLKNKRAYWAVDMGLGKTAMALHGIERIGKPALVIAPLRTISTTWPDEIKKWGMGLSVEVLHGTGKAGLERKADIYTMNFEGIKWLYKELLAMARLKIPPPFSVIVIDEGTMVKSHSTKRFKMLKAMLALFPEYRLILSGTPAPNGYQDLWSQYYLLDEGEALKSHYTHFKNKYFRAIDYQHFTWVPKQGAKEEIQDLITPMTFRLDAKDHLDLPDRVNNIINVPLPKKVRKMYKELEKEFFIELNDYEVEAFNKAALSMKLRQFMQGAVYSTDEEGVRTVVPIHLEKVKALKDLVESSGQGILCAIQFRFELDMILKEFPDTPVIAGGTTAAQATEYINAWNKGEIPLLLCHPASISHGVNLQEGGHIVLWYSQTWNAEHYLQFNGRLHRQGQKNIVVIHHLVVEDSIDEKVYQAVAIKNKGQQALLDYLREESV